MIKEINLIDKDFVVEKLEGFVKSFGGDVEKYTGLIEGVNYAIAEISVTKPKAKIFEEVESEPQEKDNCNTCIHYKPDNPYCECCFDLDKYEKEDNNGN